MISSQTDDDHQCEVPKYKIRNSSMTGITSIMERRIQPNANHILQVYTQL